jgi:uncharacterized protein YjaG (DUF416 family)
MNLLPEDIVTRLLSLSAKKKLAFAVLLFERMIPELRTFTTAERRDFSCFQAAREEFWRSLKDGKAPAFWASIREKLLNATPDSEEFGSLEASFALNAALVAADTAGFLADGQDSHLIETFGYAENSLDAYVINEMGVVLHDRTIDDFVKVHPLVRKEKRAQEDDLAFLNALPDAPWPANIFSRLQGRAEAQSGLLELRELQC